MAPTPDNDLTHRVIGRALEVHYHLGPGLLESIYEECLCREFARTGIEFARQRPLPVMFKGENIDCELRLDLVAEEALVVERKSVARLHPIHEAQRLTYLRLSGIRLGLLINFNEVHLKEGIRRRRL